VRRFTVSISKTYNNLSALFFEKSIFFVVKEEYADHYFPAVITLLSTSILASNIAESSLKEIKRWQ
jgi:hypothetical protein